MNSSVKACLLQSVLVIFVITVVSSVAYCQTTGEDAVYNSSGTAVASPPYLDLTPFSTAGRDICTTLNHVISGTVSSSFHAGWVIDARGLNSSNASFVCGANESPWQLSGGNYANIPSTILLPAAAITIPMTWVLPNGTKIVGENNMNAGSTTLVACTTANGCSSNFSTGTPMIQFGDSHCPTDANGLYDCTGVHIENLILDGQGLSVNGIQNSDSRDWSYADHITMNNILGTGLYVYGDSQDSAQNSGPYSNLMFDTGAYSGPAICAQIAGLAATRGIHQLTCKAPQGSTAVYLDASNTTLEDVRILGFINGVLVGSQQTARSNVLLNVYGDTQALPIYTAPVVVVNIGANATDLTIVGTANAGGSGTYTIVDNLNSPGIAIPDPYIGLYVVGRSSNNGYARFTTSPHAPSWSTGTSTPSAPCAIGSLYSNLSIGTLSVCTYANGWQAVPFH
jgi:hypothetical protein